MLKPDEIREMSKEEMARKLADLKESFFNLRFQHTVNQLENPKKLTQTRRDIARIKTIMNEA